MEAGIAAGGSEKVKQYPDKSGVEPEEMAGGLTGAAPGSETRRLECVGADKGALRRRQLEGMARSGGGAVAPGFGITGADSLLKERHRTC